MREELKKSKRKNNKNTSIKVLGVLAMAVIIVMALLLAPKPKYEISNIPRQKLPQTILQQQFKPWHTPTAENTAMIKNFDLKRIDTGVKLIKPTDLAVNGDGNLMLVADSGVDVIYLLEKTKDYSYRLKSKIYMEKHSAIADFFGWHRQKAEPIYLYCDFNEKLKTVYGLDGDAGVVKEFNYDGSYILTVFDSPSLLKARSLRFSRNGDIAGISIPMQNEVITFGSNNSIIDSYSTVTGTGLGQISQPGFIGFDSRDYRYVIDANNSRVEVFDDKMNYTNNYYIGGWVSTIAGPQLAVVDSAAEPYMVVSDNTKKALLFYFLKKNIEIAMDVNNFCIASDSSGNLYTIDNTKANDIFITKIKILEDIGADIKNIQQGNE